MSYAVLRIIFMKNFQKTNNQNRSTISKILEVIEIPNILDFNKDHNL